MTSSPSQIDRLSLKAGPVPPAPATSLRTIPGKAPLIANAFRDRGEPAADITAAFESLVGRAMSRFARGRNAGKMPDFVGFAVVAERQRGISAQERGRRNRVAILRAIADGATHLPEIKAASKASHDATLTRVRAMIAEGLIAASYTDRSSVRHRPARIHRLTRAGRAWLAEQEARQ